MANFIKVKALISSFQSYGTEKEVEKIILNLDKIMWIQAGSTINNNKYYEVYISGTHSPTVLFVLKEDIDKIIF